MGARGRVVTTATSVALLAGAAAAHADEMSLGVGLGGGAQLGGELREAFSSRDEVGGRATLGWRRASTQIEASFFGTDVHLANSAMYTSHSTLTLGIGVKQYVTLLPFLELYARGALDYTWLEPCPGKSIPPLGYSGSGFDYGAGVELGWRKRVPAGSRKTRIDSVGAVLWLDLGRQHLTLEADDMKPLAGTVELASVGFSFTTAY